MFSSSLINTVRFSEVKDKTRAAAYPGLFTDQKSHDVGTAKPGSKESAGLDTPALAELWRTAPYLHDGSAATVREVAATRNPDDLHGKTSQLSVEDIDALVAYLLSL